MPSLDPALPADQLTRAMCDVESVSGNEKALADAIEAALTGLDHLEVVRDGDAVVARTNLGRNRRVVFAGHIDTVPVNDNLPVRETDGWLWGRGTVDMKAGASVHLKLAVELNDPAVDVTWIWYDHEEVEASLNGLGRLARTRPDLLEGDFAILGEPTDGLVEGGCNGTLRAEIRTTGLRAHSARAWKGVNAIHAAAPVLAVLADYEPATVTVDGLDYREGLSAVAITGGVAGNVIPDDCVVTINYRYAPDKRVDEAFAHVQRLFTGLEVTLTDHSDGARPGLDDPLAAEFLAAVGVEASPKYGWTDVARFAELGVPAVNYGPGDPSLAHADDERVAAAQILECERALRAWLTAS